MTTTILWAAGAVCMFLGEWAFHDLWDGSAHWPLTGLGLVAMLVSLGLRVPALGTASGARKEAVRNALIWGAVATASLLLYVLSLDATADALALSDEAARRFHGSFASLFPVVLLVGALPMALSDLALAQSPVVMPVRAPKRAVETGLVIALGLSLVFPLNYIAAKYEVEWDLAYFRTTRPGTATLALAQSLSAPVEVSLFFPPGNDVANEVSPYFEHLAEVSSGLLTARVLDQAEDPELAEKLKIRENGWVVLAQGEATEKFKLDDDLDKARRKLKKLDSDAQEHLLKLTRGPRTAYFLAGHGEASVKEKDDPRLKLGELKKDLEDLNYKVESFGLDDGSAEKVPDDAELLVVAAPRQPLLQAEEDAIAAYFEKGGHLLVMAEPGGDPLTGLLAKLGLKTDGASLAHASRIAVISRRILDRSLLLTNKYGSHPSMKTLSGRSDDYIMLTPTALALEEVETPGITTTALLRTFDDTWKDANLDYEKDEGEESGQYVLAWAVTGTSQAEGKEPRAIVVGDVTFATDFVLKTFRLEANEVFVKDSARWLVGEESLAGETESEEDVKIEHSKDSDSLWFWSTVLGVPLLVLALGGLFTTMRRRTR